MCVRACTYQLAAIISHNSFLIMVTSKFWSLQAQQPQNNAWHVNLSFFDLLATTFLKIIIDDQPHVSCTRSK